MYADYSTIYEKQFIEEKNAFIDSSNQIEQNINRTMSFISSLRGFVISNLDSGITHKEFNTFAKEAQSPSNYIKNFSVAPNNIQAYVYPLEGNELTIDHDLANDDRESVRNDVNLAMISGKIVLSGPYELRQGGLGMIVRNPIFKENEYWGVINVVVDVESIIKDSFNSIDNQNPFSQLSNSSGVFWETPIKPKSTIKHTIHIGGNEWIASGVITTSLKSTQKAELIINGIIYFSLISSITIIIGIVINNNLLLSNRIKGLIYTDTLTLLPNRRSLLMDIDNLIASQTAFGIAFLDLDNFKDINDNEGHTLGDKLLVKVAQKLSIINLYKAYRWGGDEFILLKIGENKDSFVKIVKDTMDQINTPIELNNEIFKLSCCSGISFYPDNGLNQDEIIKLADASMYYAKNKGANNLQLYNEEIGYSLNNIHNIENKLEMALENNDLEMYYQPQLNLQNGKIQGFEALLRWKDENGEFIPPSFFIPIAERSQIIKYVDEYVLIKVVKQMEEWLTKGLKIKVSINISAYHFDDDLCKFLFDLLDNSKINSSQIELEITESFLVKDLENSKKLIQQLLNYGFSIAMDDFGTGYSSLNYLSQLNFTTLKIDGSFVSKIGNEDKEVTVINTIIDIAKILNIKTVAEGVETPQQLSILTALGCNSIQGYLLSRPLPAKEIEIWLNEFDKKSKLTVT